MKNGTILLLVGGASALVGGFLWVRRKGPTTMSMTVPGTPDVAPSTPLAGGLPIPKNGNSGVAGWMAGAAPPSKVNTALDTGTRPDIVARRQAAAQVAASTSKGGQDLALAAAGRSLNAAGKLDAALGGNSRAYVAAKEKAVEAGKVASSDAVAAAAQASSFVQKADAIVATAIRGLRF